MDDSRSTKLQIETPPIGNLPTLWVEILVGGNQNWKGIIRENFLLGRIEAYAKNHRIILSCIPISPSEEEGS